MGKLPLIAGIAVAGFLLFQFHTGKITLDDVLRLTYQTSVVPNETEPMPETQMADGTSEITATIVPINYLEDFFQNLKTQQQQNIKTFIVIANNPDFKGRYKIALSKKSINTPSGILQSDVEMIEKLLASGSDATGTAYNPFYDNIGIKKTAAEIKKKFPESKIVPIAIKDFTTNEELEKFAELLPNAPDKALIVAPLEISNNDFDQQLLKNIIETFDKKSTNGLDTENNQIIYLLLNYLEILGAKKSSMQENGTINFYEGQATANDRDLSILAFGDMMLGRHVRVLMNLYGKNYLFENIAGSDGEFGQFFKGSDTVFANLEGPIHGQGSSGGTSLVFSFNEDIAPFLKKYGFNLFSVSNNHAVDQGWDGRGTTIDALNNAGLGWCGHPSEAEEASVYYGKVLDKDFAFICFQDITFKLDDNAAVELVKKVRPNVDYLIVSIHWGYEYKHQPDFATQIEPGRAFIDAGADFVIGHHPHVVQSFEIYKDRFIFYSLGNFIFDQYWSKDTQEQLGLGIVLDDADNYDDASGGSFKTKVYLIPMKSEASQPRLMTEEERNEWTSRFIDYGEYSEEIKDMIRDGVIEN